MSLLYQCHIPPAWQEKDIEDLAENEEKGEYDNLLFDSIPIPDM